MKKILTICLLLFSTTAFAQLTDGTYSINQVITGTVEYKITEIPPSYVYGNFVTFDSKAGTFASYYTAWCGNDCFPSSKGNYTVIDVRKIRLHLLEVEIVGECENSHSTFDLDLGIFLVKHLDDSIYLIPVKNMNSRD